MTSLNEIYETTCRTMGELQPVAFLLSASLVISGLYTKDGSLQINRVQTLFASACFFFAYISLMGFKLTNFKWFFILGASTLALAFYFIFRAVIGIITLATNLNDTLPIIGRSSSVGATFLLIISSFIVILTAYSVVRVKNTRFCKNVLFNKIIRCGFYSIYILVFIITLMIIFVQSDIPLIITWGILGILAVNIITLSTLLIHSVLTAKQQFVSYE
jgi:hypothetical protein